MIQAEPNTYAYLKILLCLILGLFPTTACAAFLVIFSECWIIYEQYILYIFVCLGVNNWVALSLVSSSLNGIPGSKFTLCVPSTQGILIHHIVWEMGSISRWDKSYIFMSSISLPLHWFSYVCLWHCHKGVLAATHNQSLETGCTDIESRIWENGRFNNSTQAGGWTSLPIPSFYFMDPGLHL